METPPLPHEGPDREASMPTSFWRSPELREHINGLDRSGFAVEFLRRNAAYRRDYARLQRRIARRATDAAAERAAFAERWGLCFCPCSG
nr:DUF6499 domain-containing protein [Acetobacter nitrogenifigens]